MIRASLPFHSTINAGFVSSKTSGNDQLGSTITRMRLSGVGSKSKIGLFRSSSLTSGLDSGSSVNRQ